MWVSLIFLLPVLIGVIAGYLSTKFGHYESKNSHDSSNVLDELNNRDRLKYGFWLIDNMKEDSRDRAERVKQRGKK